MGELKLEFAVYVSEYEATGPAPCKGEYLLYRASIVLSPLPEGLVRAIENTDGTEGFSRAINNFLWWG